MHLFDYSRRGAGGPTLAIRFPKSYADRVQRFRVPGGFVLLGAFMWFSDPDWTSIAWGLPVSLLGMALRAWAAGHLAKNESLAQSGPYAHVRNPLYAGSLLVAAGVVIASRSWAMAAIFAAAFVLIYVPVIQLEEEQLRVLFPEYAAYASRVPLLLPAVTAHGGNAPFRAELFHRNKEWKAAAGFLFAVAWLIVKAVA